MKRFALILCLFLIPGMAFAASQDTSNFLTADVITQIRYYLNEPVEDTWSDTELLGWINDAQMDIVSRSQCLEAQENIDLAAETLEYSITTTYIAVTAVTYSPTSGVTKGLVRGHPSQVGHTGKTGVAAPNRWYEWKGDVGIYPVLSSRSTEEIAVFLVEEPQVLTSTTVSQLVVPKIYDRATVLYSAAQAFLKTGQYAKSGRLLAEYYAELERFRQDYVMRPRVTKDTIRND